MKDYFKHCDSAEKAYWLGFLYADGYVDREGKYLKVQLKRTDENHLVKFCNIFSVDVKQGETFDARTQKTYRYCYCYIFDTHLVKHLDQYGIVTAKTFLDAPGIYDTIPPDFLSHFIRGFFDGDGCVSKRKNGETNFTLVGNKSFLERTQQIISVATSLPPVTMQPKKRIWAFAWGGNYQLVRLREWLYRDATVWLERKRDLFDSMTNKMERGKSKFRGVTWERSKQKWQARCCVNGHRHHLGFFTDDVLAALAYNDFVLSQNLPASWVNNIPSGDAGVYTLHDENNRYHSAR